MTRLLLIAGLLVSVSAIAAGNATGFSLNLTEEVQKVSATRQIYLEKIHILERQLSDIDLKWNWVQSVPSEDSIAKAEGWYTFMEQRRKDLKADVVHVKLEQLVNYYNDILKFPVTPETIQQVIIPQMQADRKLAAADYPEHAAYLPSSESEVTALELWMVNSPEQYNALADSLEQLVIHYLN